MFDGIKIQDVSIKVDGNGQPALLKNDRLTFGGLVDTQTGIILDPVRRAYDRGLTFRLVPRRIGQGYRVEVKGSLHKFYNEGLHNADQYTANDLLLTLDQLVNNYGFNLSNSVINNIEFGINIELPFPVSHVLDNLICYKNQPFAKDSDSQTPYYICQRQRYAVKLYDKGKQKELEGNLLRFEIRVKKMKYFDGTGIQLRTLADLINVANYGTLGILLVDTFNEILFDDPVIILKSLTAKQRDIYQRCRNPRYWHTPANLTPRQAVAHRQQLSRDKGRFRALLNQYGSSWQKEVLKLIRQIWEQLTTIDDNLLTLINTYKIVWQNLSKLDNSNESIAGEYNEETMRDQVKTCHKLTDSPNTNSSQINPLYSQVDRDTLKTDQPLDPRAIVCPVTGVTINQPQPQQRFVSASMLRDNDDLMLTLDCQNRQYTKGSKEDPYSRVAHNIRNRDSNRRNNLKRSINKINQNPTLFDVTDTLRLTVEQQTALDHWKGTPFEL